MSTTFMMYYKKMKKKFAERLKQLRLDNGLTQAQLGNALKVEQQQVARWESGKILPDTITIISLTAILMTSADYLLGIKNYEYESIRTNIKGNSNNVQIGNKNKA